MPRPRTKKNNPTNTPPNTQVPPPQPAWNGDTLEYTTVWLPTPTTNDTLSPQLNQLGSQGWDVCLHFPQRRAVSSPDRGTVWTDGLLLVLKRTVTNHSPPNAKHTMIATPTPPPPATALHPNSLVLWHGHQATASTEYHDDGKTPPAIAPIAVTSPTAPPPPPTSLNPEPPQ